MVRLLGKARRDAVVGEAQLDIPQVGQVADQVQESFALHLAPEPPDTHVLFGGEAHGDRAVIANGLPGDLDHLAQQARTVLESTAIAVGPLVVAGQEKLERQVSHAGIDVDDVESCRSRPLRSVALPRKKVSDIGSVHCSRLDRVGDPDRLADSGGRQRRLARHLVGDHATAMPQFDAGQRAVGVNRIDHDGLGTDVGVIPQTGKRIVPIV